MSENEVGTTSSDSPQQALASGSRAVQAATRLLGFLDTPEGQRRSAMAAEAKQAAAWNRQADSIHAVVRQLGKRYERCSLDSFEVYHPHQQAALDSLRGYEDRLLENLSAGNGLVLYGLPGTGKDHLLAALLLAAGELGRTVRWESGLGLYAKIRDQFDADQSERAFVDSLAKASVLAISDPIPPWGNLSQFQAAKLLEIVDRRYRDMKATWVTLNVANAEEAVQRIGAATVDRLSEGALRIFCDWPSYRRRCK